MDCRKFHKDLENYLQGELDFPGRFGMERHAQQCYGCGRELAGAQRLGQMARELGRVSAPLDFELTVLNRIHAQGSRSRFWDPRRFWIYGFDFSRWRAAAIGASVLAFLGLGIFLAIYWAGPAYSSRPKPSLVAAPANIEVSSKPETADIRNSAPEALQWSDSYSRKDGFATQIEPSEYVDYLVPGPGDRQMIVRLPMTIRIRYGQPSEEYYIRNVSH